MSRSRRRAEIDEDGNELDWSRIVLNNCKEPHCDLRKICPHVHQVVRFALLRENKSFVERMRCPCIL
jgi:hypothetical protein